MTNYANIGKNRNIRMKITNGVMDRPRCRNPDCQRPLYHRTSIIRGVCEPCEREGK